ncbi:MAG: serine/threonine-protein kinase, partial [Woeseiaceae bacterium]
MASSSDSSTTSYEEQLSALERRLHAQIDDETTVQDLHSAISTLLSNGHDAETDIRAVLRRRFAAGQMREETYQLVQQILDRIVTEDVATFPDASAAATGDEDPFSDTTVLPGDAFSPEPDEGRLQVGSVIRDRFLLQEKIAGGSMGVVFKALDRRLAEADGVSPYVAIKVLSPKLAGNGNALRALQQEAAKGRCLSHANVVRFIDLDRDDDLYFIVMEWLEGRSLADILDDKRGARIDKATALDIVRQTGAALDYAHRCGVIHADVKPGNIMITPAGQVKLFDFGVARVRQKQQVDRPGFDSAVLSARTPAYSSMQVLTGEDPVPADDVFSLGCLLYRLLAGYRVFGPRNAAEAAEAGMEPQRLQELSHAEWAALRRSLAYARVARFATVNEFLRALEGQGKAEYPAEAEADDEAPPEGGRSLRKLLLAVAVLLVAGLAAYHFAPLDRLTGLPGGEAGTVPLEADVDEPAALPGVDGDRMESAALPGADGDRMEPAAAPDLMSDDSGAAPWPGVDAPRAAVPDLAADALPSDAGLP